MTSDAPTVFISYSHDSPEHKERVLALADRLRDDGVDAHLDRYVDNPSQGWQLWMEDEIEDADFVLVVATETYEKRRRGREQKGKGHGVRWEGAILSQTLYDKALENDDVIPVVFSPADAAHIPVFLRVVNSYDVGGVGGYEALYRRLTNQPEVVKRPLGKLRKLPPRQPVDDASRGPRTSISRLPATGEHFVGRDDELTRLDDAWADASTNVISFVAFGGVGKSTLVNCWLDRLGADGWRGAKQVLGWSFYSQGTRTTAASGDAFVEYALEWLGYEGEPIQSPRRKGEVLAEHVRAARTLLVLDGLEPLQDPADGRLKDPAVAALVRELAFQNPGLCVITTRLQISDVAGRAGAPSVDLEKLPEEAGAELLKKLEIKGPDEELRKTSEEFGGHALALTLLGTYLRDICDGDVRRRSEVPLLDEETEQGGRARRVMASYESWLDAPELQVLHVIGLFDRPAEADALAALRAEPPIPGLTEKIRAGDETRWKKALARLRRARLLAKDDGSGGVDTHPLVREYFGERLLEKREEAWRAGHERLYEHYKQAAPELPDTLEEMLPLYAAVVHGCRAGRVQEACDEVYKRRIHRFNEFYSLKKLGAFGSELTALASFFDRPWDRPSAQLTAADQAFVLTTAGSGVLRAVGRLSEAIRSIQAGQHLNIASKDWKNAALQAGNLSELTLTLGDVASAVRAGEESVELADKSENAGQRMINRTTLADALHQAGRWEESAASFREAEAMQAERQPQYPRLYSVQGFRYCDLLLGRAEPEDGSGLDGVSILVPPFKEGGLGGISDGDSRPSDPEARLLAKSPLNPPFLKGGRPERATRYRKACEEVRERASQTLEWVTQGGLGLLTIALDHLTLGRAHLGLALTSESSPDFKEAEEHLDRAVEVLRRAGQDQEIPRGLLARATLRRFRGSSDGAASDLREAQEIAERGHMRLHEADVHLEWTRLFLQSHDEDAARRHLERARELVTSTGYGRREREVAYLEERLTEIIHPASERSSSC